MGDKTKIEWCDATWNPLAGCRRTSPACQHCYAERLAATRLAHLPAYGAVTSDGRWNGKTARAPAATWTQPIRWRRPRRIFVCSMSDLFYEGHTPDEIAEVFAVMSQAPRHTFLVLTKRADRMRELVGGGMLRELVSRHTGELEPTPWAWPLPNVHLGVSAEDQERWDERVPHLQATPAAVRFVSAEPLLGAIEPTGLQAFVPYPPPCRGSRLEVVIHQVISGGESGPGARPTHPDWVRQLRDGVKAAGSAFFHKQNGEWLPFYDRDHDDPDWRNVPKEEPGKVSRLNLAGGQGFHGERVVYFRRVGKKAAGRELDGRIWNEMPGQPGEHG